MTDELYWMNGFVFYFKYKDENEEKSNVISLEMISETPKSKTSSPILIPNNENNKNNNLVVNIERKSMNEKTEQELFQMQIKIITNEDPNILFQSLHLCIQKFVNKNFSSRISKEIRFRINDDNKVTSEKSFNVSKNDINNNLLANLHSSVKKANCAFCGMNISLSEEITECDSCSTDHFLIEGVYAVKKVIGQGGFGRIFKAVNIQNGNKVAIKERLKDNIDKLEMWKHEISMLRLIQQKIPQFRTTRVIEVLDDKSRNILSKYFVLEFIDGKNLTQLFQRNLNHCSFNSQKDFLRMCLILLQQSDYLHSNQFLHRDIKTENIMVVENEKEKQLYFVLIDFGSSYYLANYDSNMIKYKTNSQKYSAPEINTEKESYSSDIYSLSISFQEVLYTNKIQSNQTNLFIFVLL
eukprot:TRINITY_DN16641_c0_g1_i1.p1 TRINITY_DN16641_c0_g1~~TRINITY_DN16641_c0_g1_i1.p1  ORF type:complete len:410 (+),score=113.48 TRINITY_DN16641_c0_g1_i1:171-1400(+)